MEPWDITTDLLVLGSGAAGMTAAVVGATEGAQVLVCEKMSQVGGTTATSAGTAWVPGNFKAAESGAPDPRDQIEAYLQAELGELANTETFRAFMESGPEAIRYLEANSQVRFDIVRNPDYHLHQPGAVEIGRALVPTPFDGRTLGEDFLLLREPRNTLMILGGMMIGRREIITLLDPFASMEALRHVVSIIVRHLSDRLRFHRGTRLMLGNALVARFLASLRHLKVPIRTNAVLKKLILREGRVEGAVVEINGVPKRVLANRGVLLATGGFPGDTPLLSRLAGNIDGIRSYAYEDSIGEGIRLAREIGASIDEDHSTPAFWTPISVMRSSNGAETLWAHHSLDRAKPGLIAVNRNGRRFVNEGDSYHDFALGMVQAKHSSSSVPAFLVCDYKFIRKYGLGLVRPRFQRLKAHVASGYLLESNSIEGLARKAGIDPGGLQATVMENNRFALTGKDEAFHKGERGLNRYYGDADNHPNPCLGPIGTPPYYAVAVYPGVIATSVGISTDADARVLTAAGTPIPGLYACGTDMSSIMKGRYLGPGINIGPAIAFGYRAALHAVGSGSNGN